MGPLHRPVPLVRRGGPPHHRPPRRKPRPRRPLRGDARARGHLRRLHRLELPGRAGGPQGRARPCRRLLHHCPPLVADPRDGDADRGLLPGRGPARRRGPAPQRPDGGDLRAAHGRQAGPQGLAHRLDPRGTADDPRRRRDREEGLHGAWRQRAADRLRRRRPGARAEPVGADQVRQRRAGLRDSRPLLRPRAAARRLRRGLNGPRLGPQGGRRARLRDADGPAHLAQAARGDRGHRRRRGQAGRDARLGWQAGGGLQQRPLLRTHGADRGDRRHARLRRGELRPHRRDHALRRGGRGAPPRQRLGHGPLGLRLHPRPGAGAPDGRRAQGRHGGDQQLRHGRLRGAVRGSNFSGMGREGGPEGLDAYLDTKLAQVVF